MNKFTLFLIVMSVVLAPSMDVSAKTKYEDVTVCDDVKPEMNDVEFWINKVKNPDKVIMTSKQIDSFNRKNKSKINDIINFKTTITKSGIKKYFYKFPDYSSKKYYVDGKRINKAFFDRVEKNIGYDSLKTKNKVGFGVITSRTNVKMFPYSKVVTDSRKNLFFDEFQLSELYYNEPVVTLMETKDKKWKLVVADHYYGWIPAKNVAEFKSKKNFLEMYSAGDFLVVTGDKVRLDINPYAPETSGMEFPMGTKLILAKKSEYGNFVDERYPLNNYVIKIPIRDKNGTAVYKYALMPVSRDVSRGYLPYTTRNVLNQCFKNLGNIYGWGGMYNSQDCSGFVKYVYACFGFEFSRDSSAMVNMPLKVTDISNLSSAEKKKTIGKSVPGSVLYLPGHIMIYLGRDNGKYYVISASGSCYSKKTGNVMQTLTVMINDIGAKRAAGSSWIGMITKMIEVKE